jgi:hypothetical protein
LVEVRVERRRCSLEFLLERLPPEDVLVLGQIAENVEVAEPVELSV